MRVGSYPWYDDEAILLADRIVLMTDGPHAKVAEIVRNPLPAERHRDRLHKEPHYYALQNHLIEFLVTRSSLFNCSPPKDYDPRHPPEVALGLTEDAQAQPLACVPGDRVVVPMRH